MRISLVHCTKKQIRTKNFSNTSVHINWKQVWFNIAIILKPPGKNKKKKSLLKGKTHIKIPSLSAAVLIDIKITNHIETDLYELRVKL